MNDQGEGNPESAATRRWTCEACGCNTNTESDSNCTICGTSNSGPSGLRRARPNWFPRSVFGRGRSLPDEFGVEDEADLWESVVDDVEMAGADHEDRASNAIESLAMEVSGMASAARRSLESRRQGLETGRQRLLDAARAFSQQPARPQVSPDELWQAAMQNAPNYSPHWMNPTQGPGRSRSSMGIELASDQSTPQLAHVPPGAGEGYAIRAVQSIPRESSVTRTNSRRSVQQVETGGNTASLNNLSRRAFGFRVAFDHPGCEPGGNLGGCYLVGVTVASFTAFGEQNGLSQSAFFWGIEDGGNKYEGARYAQPNRGSRRLSASYASEVNSQDVPMNESNLLFGSREVVSVLCDLEARTLTFWRNDTLLGTLVSNLPRSGNLYPVAVPFNNGVAVAITGLDGDPLPILQTFSADARRVLKEKEEAVRSEVFARRQKLFRNGNLTKRLRDVLLEIYTLYSEEGDESLVYSSAARLFYRSGMKLDYLDTLIKENGPNCLTFLKFYEIIEKILQEDDESVRKDMTIEDNAVRKGDKVELVEGYEKYEDASGGPLKPGDRGTVVEVQNGPNGERSSIRVLYNGRRWWYQPQAVVSERSGLIDSSGVWFLATFLRSHGYDPSTLEHMQGKQVNGLQCQIGDVVVPVERILSYDAKYGPCIGRIVADSAPTPSGSTGDGSSVSVEFVNPSFGSATGAPRSLASVSSSHIERRRIRVNKVVHSTFILNQYSGDKRKEYSGNLSEEGNDDMSSDLSGQDAPSEKNRTDLIGVSRLEGPALENMTKECKKSPDSLAAMFSAGLPESLLSATDVAQRQMNSLEPREDLPERISALGSLTLFTADQLFSGSPKKYGPTELSERHFEEELLHQALPSDTADNMPTRAAMGDSRGQNANNSSRRSSNNVRGLVASIQQRRSFLRSLMSRGSIRQSHVQGLAAMEAVAMGMPAHAYQGGDGVFSRGRSDHEDAVNAPWDESAQGANEMDEGASAADDGLTAIEEKSFLDSIRRKRGFVSSKSRARTAGMSQLVFQRRLFEYGLLPNSLAWTKALIDDFGSKGSIRLPSLLRHASDEEGKSALFLALSFGCSSEVIRCLLGAGAQVGAEEIRLCISTNMHEILSVLLRHGSMPDDFDMKECSAEVAAVIDAAKKRQDDMDRKMRENAGSFMVDILRKIIKLALQARRHRSPRLDLCSRVISEMLVGNVLLQALQEAQKDTKKPELSEDEVVSAAHDDSLSLIHPAGLLNSLPAQILGEALFADAENATSFFLLLEDYLCNKEMPYVAAGLNALVCALRQFPQLRSSPEMDRYGMLVLAEFHDELASNRCAEILSRQLTKRLEVSASTPSTERRSSCSTRDHSIGSGVVMCPQKHRALLHVTRHSSFRCDLCGSGVDRGRPMHGCRECDWDACEDCTDLAESGLLKCSAIRELALECRKLLAHAAATEVDVSIDISETIEALGQNKTVDIEAVAQALVEHDHDAVEELARLLRTPGLVTIHQFMEIILPAIHSACLGRSSENSCVKAGHKNKKAKVGMFFGDDKDVGTVSSVTRSQFCNEMVKMLILEHGEKVSKAALTEKPQEGLCDERDEDVEAESELMMATSSEPAVSGREISFYAESSELLRRLQQVLTLHERVSVMGAPPRRKPTNTSGSAGGADLQVLTSPLELELLPSSFGEPAPCARNRLLLQAEPLLPLAELELHVLRASVLLDPGYIAFCQSLSSDKAVILERSKKSAGFWNLSQVVSFDEESGVHGVRRASGRCGDHLCDPLRVHHDAQDIAEIVVFDPKVVYLVLSSRDYVILNRNKNGKAQSTSRQSPSGEAANFSRFIGTRAEYALNESRKWEPVSVVKCEGDGSSGTCTVVSDDGLALVRVPISSLRGSGISEAEIEDEEDLPSRMSSAGGRGSPGDSLARAFPFFATRSRPDESREAEQAQKSVTALKRTWSALSLAEALSPFDLGRSEAGISQDAPVESQKASFTCKVGEENIGVVSDITMMELPPKLEVRFNVHEKLPGVEFSNSKEVTLVRALQVINDRREDCVDYQLCGQLKLFYGVSLIRNSLRSIGPLQQNSCAPGNFVDSAGARVKGAKVPDWDALAPAMKEEPLRRTRQFSGQSQLSDDVDATVGLCDGLNDVCVQCMEVIDVLSGASGYNLSSRDRHSKGSAFANDTLSKKLLSYLEDPLAVVGGVLPEWCIKAPSFAPRVFTYDARKALLDCSAFGVSRSTFRQQESKINIGKLRQRMASLRGRAVELVGEAFSGGAEDPTALQLQADELYGMEEALASRVRAMFRAAGWQEHSLQVAKAAVRRANLLDDAALVMRQYATDLRVIRRRLEVRFDGESGFDAASGDEAGVTRGFYADVAEALLSSDIVAGVHCSRVCSEEASISEAMGKSQPMDVEDMTGEKLKLPLWIPDMDSGAQVVIPTPRAGERSAPGLFPRPLPSYHPQMEEVKEKFRFMGRLFAAALRDGFMFPLPLSSSFLKLVQHCVDEPGSEKAKDADCAVLTSSDLPRPGFLGGEIYAADAYICRALDKVEASDPPLPRPELLKKYSDIASDKNFARVAFGKSYDCSFDEYFQDKTFVDPLDPGQDENAVPLCPKGSQTSVTVYNVQEWVHLAKRFFLYDGVISQARAFRQGVDDFFPSRYLLLFTPEELQHDVCGVGDNVEEWDESAVRKIFKLDGGKGAAEALVAVAAMGGEGGAALSRRFGPSSPTISYLVKALLEGTPQQRRQFLSFVTSVPIVTPGRIEVVPIVSPTGDFLPFRDPGCLPRANTCARRLYLPKFEDYECFSKVLWAVVREESKFKGFFEWRG
ncbi:hypothetical protein ACA910_013300 [Epithemia clementina (nom. ined.)]